MIVVGRCLALKNSFCCIEVHFHPTQCAALVALESKNIIGTLGCDLTRDLLLASHGGGRDNAALDF